MAAIVTLTIQTVIDIKQIETAGLTQLAFSTGYETYNLPYKEVDAG